MNKTMDPVFAAALRRELTVLPVAKKKHARRRIAVATGVFALAGLSTVAVANLRPADQIAAAPLAAPVIVNGVGTAMVPLPAAPDGARYVHFEIACFNGTKCASPAGSVTGPDDGGVKVERGSLPLTDERDGNNPQSLRAINPDAGLRITVNDGTHWRLYAVYTADLNSKTGPLADGRTLGIPGNEEMPQLIPAVTTDGRTGWIEYAALTFSAKPQLTGTRVVQSPLPAYAADGTTVIGEVNVSASWR